MKPSTAWAPRALLWLNLFSYTAQAADIDCDSDFLVINNAADAEVIGSSCPILHGTVVLNNTAVDHDVDFSGVEIIEGSIIDRCVYSRVDSIASDGSCSDEDLVKTPFTLTSSTLSEIKGNITLSALPGLVHLAFPSLESSGGIALSAIGLANLSLPSLESTKSIVLWDMTNLTYLDISNLAVVNETLALDASSLQTIVHTTAFTYANWLEIRSGQMDSISNLINGGFKPETFVLHELPNLNDLTLDFVWNETIDRISPVVQLNGNGNLSVVIGRPSLHANFSIGELHISGGVRALERHPDTEHVWVGSFGAHGGNNITDLTLPFDSVRYLKIVNEQLLEHLRNTPLALQWGKRALEIQIDGCPGLDITSQFIEENGTTTQTWWWPQNGIQRLVINANVTNDFFKPWLNNVAYTDGTDREPQIMEFRLRNMYDTTNTTIDCVPFDEIYTPTLMSPNWAGYNLYECWGKHAVNSSNSSTPDNQASGSHGGGIGPWAWVALATITAWLL